MISTEDKIILSTLTAFLESFAMQEVKTLAHDPQAQIFITGFNDFFFNNICLNNPTDQDKLIEEIKDFHSNLNKPLMVWITPETISPGLKEKLEVHFDCHGDYYGMLLDVNQAQLTERPEHISIKEVSSAEEARDFSEIFCNLFQLGNMHEHMTAWLIKQYQSNQPQAINYISKINGQLAGICTLTLNDQLSEYKVGGFYNTCVLPQYRKLGVGTAMASHRVREAKKLGLKYLSVILMSDAMARGYCQRLGFQNCKTLTPFFLPV